MNKAISVFLERLAERFVALFAGLISSRIETFHAAARAEQQSHLEDLAREYEAAGKIEIATSLREQARGLTSSNLASEATNIVRNVSGESLNLTGPHDAGRNADLRSLPKFGEPASPAKSKRPRANGAKKSADVTGDLL